MYTSVFPACTLGHHMHSRSLRKPEECAKSTGTGVTGDCGSLCGSGNQICVLHKSSQRPSPLDCRATSPACVLCSRLPLAIVLPWQPCLHPASLLPNVPILLLCLVLKVPLPSSFSLPLSPTQGYEHGCAHTRISTIARVWRSEDNWPELVLPFHCAVYRDLT